MNGAELHYVFYTSQNSPTTDLVVLWLNGGPGCSSMEGTFMENGPFIFSESNYSSYENPYSWNKVANMLYFESPAGVGYSVMGSLSNNHTNDNITAEQNLAAIVQWFAYFPEFTSNDFYIAGESYAGVYVPYLAYYIQQYNKDPETKIHLTGILVGNPVTDWKVDADSVWPYFLYSHELIDASIYTPWVNNNCSIFFNLPTYCTELYEKMLNLFTGINYYDIYRKCIYPTSAKPIRTNWGVSRLGGIEDCIPNQALVKYMNSPSVRDALHINTTLGAWMLCNNIDYDYDNYKGSYYLYPSLISSGIRINIYSGDTDSCVPTYGTREWINNLGLPIGLNWTEWYLDGQVAGFYMRYQTNFRFNTIRGSGHMCIQWKPAQGLMMFTKFLLGQDLSS